MTQVHARWLSGDVAGSVADLGVLLPLVSALVLSGGFDAGTVLVGVGTLYVVSGLAFRVPVPVQPIKAAAAITIARELPPAQLAVAGLILGLVLVALSLTGLAHRLAAVFTEPIVRGLQLGVGLILVRTSWRLAGPDPSGAVILCAVAVTAVLLVGTLRRLPLALPILVVGVAWSLAHTSVGGLELGLWQPRLAFGDLDAGLVWGAIGLLVIPQLPLTFGNAVVGVSKLEHEYYGPRARRVSEPRIALSCGLANIAVGVVGGMPMCHGSSGLTAHFRAGAQTARMNLVIGVPLLAVGVIGGPAVLPLLALVPAAVLAGFLAFTGLLHAGLAWRLRGYSLATAVTMAAVGFVTANLAWSLLTGLVLHWAPIGVRRLVLRPSPAA